MHLLGRYFLTYAEIFSPIDIILLTVELASFAEVSSDSVHGGALSS